MITPKKLHNTTNLHDHAASWACSELSVNSPLWLATAPPCINGHPAGRRFLGAFLGFFLFCYADAAGEGGADGEVCGGRVADLFE